MTNEHLLGKILNELSPQRGSMDIWREVIHSSFILSDRQRGIFYDRFYNMFNAREISTADEVSDICEQVLEEYPEESKKA